MYKISWAQSNDEFSFHFVLAPDVHSLYSLYWTLTGYGREDSCTPIKIKVTNLDGIEVNMSEGLASVAGQGTRTREAS